MGSNDLITLFFLVAAVLIFLQLRNVLGRRTGNEKPPFDPFGMRESNKDVGGDRGKKEDANVISFPKKGETMDSEKVPDAIDRFAAPDTALNGSLRKIANVDPSFDPADFLNGARMAYEMIVNAFAEGDRTTLSNLLSRDVYESFDQVLTQRERDGIVLKSSFVGIEKAQITNAELKGNDAVITLRIISQIISATYDKDGTLIDGDAEEVGEVRDIWSFSKDLKSSDPNWKLISTASEG